MGFQNMFQKLFQKKKKQSQLPSPPSSSSDEKGMLFSNLEKNKTTMKQALGNSSDLGVRQLTIPTPVPLKVMIFFMEGLADVQSIHNFILEPLTIGFKQIAPPISIPSKGPIGWLKEEILAVGSIHEVQDFQTAFHSLL